MMASGSSSKYTEEERQWHDKQRQEDEQRKMFYEKINLYPNLFTLKALLRHRQRAEHLLKKQRSELEAGWFQYPMEVDRCKNLIAFLLYLLEQRKDALDYCQTLVQESTEDSIIRMTTWAVLQWEMGQREKANKTVGLLHELSSTSRFRHLKAIAVSEQGHALTHFGPKYFIDAIDKLREALQTFPDHSLDSYYLWKYDLALAIRRNFNVFVYRAHPRLSAPDLAEEAMTHFRDISTICPNRFYRVRGLAELASLVSTIKQFIRVCDAQDRSRLTQFKRTDVLYYIHKALITPEGQRDHFVLRVAGRLFMYGRWFILARRYLQKSLQLKKDCITYQLLGKSYLTEYRSDHLKKRRVSHVVASKLTGHFDCRHVESAGDTWRRFLADEDVLQGNIRPAVQNVSQDTSSLATDFENSLQICDPGNDRSADQPSSHHTLVVCSPCTSGIKRLLKAFQIASDLYDEHDPDVRKAQDYFCTALQLDPHNTGLLYDAGLMYQGMDKPQEALELFQNIVSNVDTRPTYRVNAYEQSGICLLTLSETATGDRKDELIERAGDMFRSSMRECQKVVRHLPRVKAELTQVWDSYSKLVNILEASTSGSGVTHLQKMAQVHEEVGKYLEASKAHHGILDLSKDPHEKRQALLGLMRNHCSRDDVTQARLIVDVCIDEGHLVKSANDDVSCKLREKAVEVYNMSARQALKAGQTRSAFLSFHSALVLLGLARDAPHPSDDETDLLTDDSEEHVLYDVCIFDDTQRMGRSDGAVPGDVSRVSCTLVTVLRHVFGMSVSRNDEEVELGHLSFKGELELARSATTVMLVIGAENKLSHRMAFLVNTALQKHSSCRVLPVVVADCERAAPSPLDSLQAFPGARDLLGMDTTDVDTFITSLAEHHDTIMRLFDFVAKPVFASQGGHRAN